MKIAGKRIPRGNALLFLSFAAISLCLLLIISATRAERANSMSRNGMYTGHQRGFYISYAEGEGQWEKVMPQLAEQYSDFAFYLPLEDPEITLRGICVQGEVEIPPMQKGKYFDFSTSWTDHPTAVVGKQYEGDVRERDGKMYYSLDEIEYEVIGIMGTENDSRINRMVFIDFKSAVRINGVNAEYVLDTKRESDYYVVGETLNLLFPLPAEVGIMLNKSKEQSVISVLLSGDVIRDTLYVMVLVSFSLSTVLVTIIWLRFRRQLLFACTLCGYEKRWWQMEIWKRFYLAAGIGFAVGLLLILLVCMMVPDISVNGIDILQAFGVTIILGSAILFFCYQIDHIKQHT